MSEPAPRHGRRRESGPVPSTETGEELAETSAPSARIPIWARESTVGRALDSAGEPLGPGVRREMEARLGADLDAVRVHTGTAADESARSLNARAYAVGADVVFGAGQYDPSTPAGRHVLAHELTHVVQQGPDVGPLRPGPGPAAAEREAHDVARSASGAAGVHPPVRRDPAAAGHVQCYDSFEHIQLGDTSAGGPTRYILLECHARDLPAHATPTVGWPPEWILRYNRGTPQQRRAITEGLTYGEILALSGDMYAEIDPRTTATSVVGTMQRINHASLLEIYELVKLLHYRPGEDPRHPEVASTDEVQRATGGRFMTLAKQNLSHFSNVNSGRNNLDTWRDGHVAALSLAAAGDANGAWAMNAASDHFLTDAFAAGHSRPDREKDMQGGPVGQTSSKVHHDLDNENGVPVHNARGDRWIAYGDDHLNDTPDDLRIAQKAFVAAAPDIGTAFGGLGHPGRPMAVPMVPPPAFTRADGLRIALEAVAASKADIQAALDSAARTGHPLNGAAVPKPPFAAERLVPVVDQATPDRWGNPDVASEIGHLLWTELPGQVSPDGDTLARDWIAKQSDAVLRSIPLDERKRMAARMLGGWVSDADLDAVVRLYRTGTFFERLALRSVFAACKNEGGLHRLYPRLDRP
ncbi:eCIS core domain-containing protein [Streptomyces sp. NBC_01262]|uniref:eCIS core domain-containing protein n=1 Tax=Streptomyces sp. NBC_01262 TaxID=2903803 RepID=UPI002E33EB74|nr:DUF4157 domain-containing protein [Streptomyces sp. NBC_01262]